MANEATDYVKLVKGHLIKEPYEVQFMDTTFFIKLRPLIPDDFRNFQSRCKKIEWDTKTHQKIEVLDDKKLTELLNDYAIVDWRGLTQEVISLLLPVKPLEVAKNFEFPCTPDFKSFLILESTPFSTFVNNVVLDVAGFSQRAVEEEAKNSKTSPDGGSVRPQ